MEKKVEISKNRELFKAARNLHLPTDQYAITGSGPLGIRNLREIADIDIIVSPTLWETLVKAYGITHHEGVQKIVFPGGIVEAFSESSFSTDTIDTFAPSLTERIAQSEMIDDLPFESLTHILYYKRKMGRQKDLKDIELIETLLKVK